MRQGFQVSHAVEVDLTHQVVELMLDDPREKTFGCESDVLAISIQRVDTQFAPARNTAAKIRNTEAALPVFDQLLIEDGDARVDQNSQRNVSSRTAAFDDRDGERFMNLRSRESD